MKRLCVILSTLFVFLYLSACQQKKETSEGFFLDNGYGIVYDADSEVIYGAAKKLQAAVKDVYGVTVILKPDTQSASEKEIILGDTSRGNLSEGLLLRDFTIEIFSDGNISIGGGQPSAVSEGVDDFIARFFSEKHAFSPKDSYMVRYDYECKSIMLNGSEISDYTVVYEENSQAGKKIVSDLSEIVAQKRGVLLRTCDISHSPGGKEIRIGVGDENGRPVFSDFDYALYADGEDIVLNATEKSLSSTDAGQCFLELFSAEAQDGVLDITVSSEFVVHETTKYLMEFVSVQRVASVCEGVSEYKYVYKNADGQQTILYAAEIKAGFGYTLAAGTVNDGYEIGNGLSATVLDMARAAEANGKEVVCVVNSGFFALSGDQHQEGVIVKDGKVLYQGSGVYAREWWALTKNNEIIFGEYYDLYVNKDPKQGFRDDLLQATAGNHLLWRDGVKTEIKDSDTALLGINPRSCFLTRENGDIVIFVADGRYGESAGLTMLEEQEIAMRLGAYNALNLDGGGSSQLVLPTGEGGALEVVNCPVGMPGDYEGHRKVADSILVLAG